MTSDQRLRNSLTVFARLWRTDQVKEEAKNWIRQTINSDPDRVLPIALEVAIETGGPVADVMEEVISSADISTETLEKLRSSIPADTVSLGEVHGRVVGLLLERGQLSQDDEVAYRIELSERLLEHGHARESVRQARLARRKARGRGRADANRRLELSRVLSAGQLRIGHRRRAVRTARRSFRWAQRNFERQNLLPSQLVRSGSTLALRYLHSGRLNSAEYMLNALEIEVENLIPQFSREAAQTLLAALADKGSHEIEADEVLGLYAHEVAELERLRALNRLSLAQTILKSKKPSDDALLRALEAALAAYKTFAARHEDSPDTEAMHLANSVFFLHEVASRLPHGSRKLHALGEVEPRWVWSLEVMFDVSTDRGPWTNLVNLLEHWRQAVEQEDDETKRAFVERVRWKGLAILYDGDLDHGLIVLQFADHYARTMLKESSHELLTRAGCAASYSQALERSAYQKEAIRLATEACEFARSASQIPDGNDVPHAVASILSSSLNGLSIRLERGGDEEGAFQAQREAFEVAPMPSGPDDIEAMHSVVVSGVRLSILVSEGPTSRSFTHAEIDRFRIIMKIFDDRRRGISLPAMVFEIGACVLGVSARTANWRVFDEFEALLKALRDRLSSQEANDGFGLAMISAARQVAVLGETGRAIDLFSLWRSVDLAEHLSDGIVEATLTAAAVLDLSQDLVQRRQMWALASDLLASTRAANLLVGRRPWRQWQYRRAVERWARDLA